jgi:LSD1 subclass zinc finger protein
MEYGTELKTFKQKNPEKTDEEVKKIDLEKTENSFHNPEPQKNPEIIKKSEETQQNHKKDLKNTIKCSKCSTLLAYPEGSYFVACPKCSSITPTVELLTLNCQFCSILSYFPKSAPTVQCRCGAIYKVN